MITMAIIGVGIIVAIAIVVGIVDATQAPEWREIAARRRRRWEARQLQHQIHRRRDTDDADDAWDDD
jgi:hypothetical protein